MGARARVRAGVRARVRATVRVGARLQRAAPSVYLGQR